MEISIVENDFIENNRNEERPEQKLLNFLIFLGEVLNSSQSWDINALCARVRGIQIEEYSETSLNTGSVLLTSQEVKRILLSSKGMKQSIQITVDYLLESLLDKIKNFQTSCATEIVYFSSKISYFIKVCEGSKISTRSSVKQFLTSLIDKLGSVNGTNFLEEGPVYQLITKIIGYFKEVEASRRYILAEISKRLKLLKTDDYECYESFLLFITVSKEILEYDFQQSVLKSDETRTKVNDDFVCLKQNLQKIMGKVPDYIEVITQDCLNLLF